MLDSKESGMVGMFHGIFKKNSELPKIHRINKDVNPDSDWNGGRKKRLSGMNR